MTHVILQPAGDNNAREHYGETVEFPVPLERLSRFISSSDRQTLEAHYHDRPVPTWGVTPGGRGMNRTKWERIEPGDVVLMARHGEIFVSGTVTHKTHSRSLARDLWGEDDDGQTWEYLYFIDEVRSEAIPYERLNDAAGYTPSARVQGFSVLDEEKSARILRAIGRGQQTESAVSLVWTLEAGDTIRRTELMMCSAGAARAELLRPHAPTTSSSLLIPRRASDMDTWITGMERFFTITARDKGVIKP